ncbi:hypothetical protein [Tenacibaculum aiptasiae]|uniref:hypothetical protein n=1 Tax=Tenacibaculum aiptasiae TaxID=426481 RepID=UPI00232C25BE|nr:hypothetical protein [Tenacibaculum aiptasiae]
MTISIKLSEVFEKCNDWENFCINEGYSEWCVSEGGGDVEITLTEKEAIEYGIINKL